MEPTTISKLSLLIHTLTPVSLYWVLGGILLLLLWRQRRLNSLRWVSGALIVNALVVELLKQILQVPRPEDALITLSSYAFPSAHAAGSMMLAITAALLLKASALPLRIRLSLTGGAVLLSLVVGFSRVGIGVHTIPQVMVGFLIGAIIPLVFYTATKRHRLNTTD